MELTENKDLLQTVFDSAPNGIAVMKTAKDEKGKVKDFSILLFNAYTRNWIGNIEYKGKLYGDIFPGMKVNGVLEKFIKVAETGETGSFETWQEGEGVKNWFHFTAVKQGDLLVVTTEDRTESKKAELALKNSLDVAEKQQRLYDSIANNTPDLVYVFSLAYKFSYANKALLTMWGKTAEDAIGKGLRENGYEEWHAQMHEREIDEIIATKKSIRGTVAFPHAELGSRVYDYILVPVFNAQGEVEAIAGTTRDVTDFKRIEGKLLQSETRLRSMIDQTPAPTMVLMGHDLVIEQINKRMLQMIGRGEEIIGHPLINVMPELRGQYIWEQVEKVFEQGVPFTQLEVQVAHSRSGVMQDYFYNIAYRPLRENEQIVGMIQVAIDVTEQVVARKKLEESEKRYKVLAENLEGQVNARTKELQRSNEDLQQFAHVASHDLKEPVRKIKTFIGRLKDQLHDTLDDSSARFIDRINVATDRMFTMIDGVLAYSTTNAGEQKPELIDLNEVIKNIENDLEVSLQKTNGKIHLHNLPKLEGAPVLIYQLFYNLINNSIKFAQKGLAPQISLSSEMDNTWNDLVHITLKDNGIGFEPENALQIFETFTRLNSKDKYEGTGLGLALCKKIVERHGGSITAAGKPDKGATFIITLPLHQKEASL
ncbi:PAS domain-containing sensor histidine kinase [Sphingobacteriaceae bacterium]|nr:PAS domain-containing sensor histidine kinase [Sphingobacteriaceae bacterium]